MSIVSLTRRGHWREGVVGEVLPDVEARIAEDGELLVKTPVLMLGYYGEPEQTKNAFTPDGFYKTGDYAEITPDRCLRLLGRKKDVFNTYDGSNIHPARIEERLERIGWVKQAALVGDQRPYVVALAVVEATGTSAEADGYLSPEQAPALYAKAGEDLAKLNTELEANERIRRFALLERPMADQLYSAAGQGKVRRNRPEIVKVYAARIEALYKRGVGAAVPGAEG
jgi:long-chain acyl-CoA synthetase